MASQSEKLTPRQQCWFTATLLVIFMAFSSVFAYAYYTGQQIRAERERALVAQLKSLQLTRDYSHQITAAYTRKRIKATPIARGRSGHPTFLSLGTTDAPWHWVIRPRATGISCARDTAPVGFTLNPKTGELHVPAHLPLGRYFLSILRPTPHSGAFKTCAHYEFEVTENTGGD